MRLNIALKLKNQKTSGYKVLLVSEGQVQHKNKHVFNENKMKLLIFLGLKSTWKFPSFVFLGIV